MSSQSSTDEHVPCPICSKSFPKDSVEVHVNRCLFLTTSDDNNKNSKLPKPMSENKRQFSVFSQQRSPVIENKKAKWDLKHSVPLGTTKHRNTKLPNNAEPIEVLSDEETTLVSLIAELYPLLFHIILHFFQITAINK